MATTVGELIANAMMDAQILGQGQTPSANDATFVLKKLNRLVSRWSTRSLFTWTIQIERFTLTPAQTSYTIGRGVSPPADFVTDRPLGPAQPCNGIIKANIVLTTVIPEARVPLQLLDDIQWGSISVTDIPTTLPVAIYNDGAYPNSRLYLWGKPIQSNDLEIFTRKQISEWPVDSATFFAEFEMPPGYEDAVTLTLAEEICIPFGISPVPADLRIAASKARQAIQALNSSAPKLTSDVPASASVSRGDGFNYRTGLFDLPT